MVLPYFIMVQPHCCMACLILGRDIRCFFWNKCNLNLFESHFHSCTVVMRLCDGHERARSAGAGPAVGLMCDVGAMVMLVCWENFELTFEWNWHVFGWMGAKYNLPSLKNAVMDLSDQANFDGVVVGGKWFLIVLMKFLFHGQYSTVQYSTVQYNTMQYNTIQYSAV